MRVTVENLTMLGAVCGLGVILIAASIGLINGGSPYDLRLWFAKILAKEANGQQD